LFKTRISCLSAGYFFLEYHIHNAHCQCKEKYICETLNLYLSFLIFIIFGYVLKERYYCSRKKYYCDNCAYKFHRKFHLPLYKIFNITIIKNLRKKDKKFFIASLFSLLLLNGVLPHFLLINHIFCVIISK